MIEGTIGSLFGSSVREVVDFRYGYTRRVTDIEGKEF